MSSIPKIFIAYSRQDESMLAELRMHLTPLERSRKVEIWYDGKIEPGVVWEQAIKEHLHSADIILLLVSASAIASDYFYDKEMKDALERHHAGSARVVPLILRPCTWQATPLGELQALPKDGKAVTSWPDRDGAYSNAVRSLWEMIKSHNAKQRESAAQKAERQRLEKEAKQREEELQRQKEAEAKRKEQQAIRAEHQRKSREEKEQAARIAKQKQKAERAEKRKAQGSKIAGIMSHPALWGGIVLIVLAFVVFKACGGEGEPMVDDDSVMKDTIAIPIDVDEVIPSDGMETEEYWIIAGAYLKKETAVKEADKLKISGYENVEIYVFDNSQYYSVCIKRINNLSEAKKLKYQLMNTNKLTEAYIHKKRAGENSNPKEVEKDPPLVPGMATIGKNMISIPAGSFTMGCTSEQGSDCDDDEKQTRKVSISRFKMGKYEVTQAEWKAMMGSNPSHFKNCDQCPVEKVSWNDIQGFLKKLNQKTGKRYRLPSEAEWEYAARGGQTYKYAGSNTIGNVAWYRKNSNSKTHPVDGKNANGYGLHEMSGNVWEWCQDKYNKNYKECTTDGSAYEASGSNRVNRGGGWSNGARYCRVSHRFYGSPDDRDRYIGFRLALSY